MRRRSPFKNENLIPLLAVLVNNLNQTVFYLVHSFYKLPTIKVDFLSVVQRYCNSTVLYIHCFITILHWIFGLLVTHPENN